MANRNRTFFKLSTCTGGGRIEKFSSFVIITHKHKHTIIFIEFSWESFYWRLLHYPLLPSTPLQVSRRLTLEVVLEELFVVLILVEDDEEENDDDADDDTFCFLFHLSFHVFRPSLAFEYLHHCSHLLI